MSLPVCEIDQISLLRHDGDVDGLYFGVLVDDRVDLRELGGGKLTVILYDYAGSSVVDDRNALFKALGYDYRLDVGFLLHLVGDLLDLGYRLRFNAITGVLLPPFHHLPQGT